MRLIYYTRTFFLDCDLPLIKELRVFIPDLYVYIDLPPCFLNTPICNIKNQPKRNDIISIKEYPEFKEFYDYLDPNKTFVVNRLKNSQFSTSNIKLSLKLFYKFKALKTDVIHLTNFLDFNELVLYFFRKKMILTVHDPIPHTGENDLRARLTRVIGLKILKRFIVLNNRQRNEFIDRYKLRNSQVFTSRLSVYSALNMNDNNTRGNYILFFGRISRYKGVENLLLAMDIVHEKAKDLKLIIAGRKNYDIDFNVYSKCKYITILDEYIDINELVTLISDCKFVVCPYLDATQSGVIMTAFAFKKPVVATNVGGLSEVVEHNTTGVIIPSNNVEILAQSIISLNSNDTLLLQMENNIQNIWFTGKESWYEIAKNLFLDYQKI